MLEVEIFDPRLRNLIAQDTTLRKRADGFVFTEGPVWHADRAVLIFSDIPASRVYEFDPATDAVGVYRDATNHTNGNAFDRQHRLISCEHATSRVVREEADGTLTVVAAEYAGAELNSPNDVVVDRSGRIVFTDPPYGRTVEWVGILRPAGQPVQGVYRVDPRDGSVTLLADDFDQPNGLCLSLSQRYLFVNDSARMHIRRFDLSGDAPTGGEIWATLEGDAPGAPDGMKVDSQDNVYCTGPGGMQVFDPAGTKLGVLRIPESVGNFTFGDSDLGTVYVCGSTSLYSFPVRVPGADLWS